MRVGRLEREILGELSAGDLLYGHLLSVHSTKEMYRTARERAANRARRKRAIMQLEQKGLVRQIGTSVSVTRLGTAAAEQVVLSTRGLLETSTWDGKWRIVTFDIPETHAPLRRRVRLVLKRAGFVQLQQSVWVFPHECAELSQLIKDESGLAPYILYGVLERIEGDEQLRRTFGM